MSPSHHPDPDELLAYASGAAPDWISLVVASHLTYCAECRGEVELLDDLGGVLLDGLVADPDTDGVRPPALPPRDEQAPERVKPDALASVESITKIPRPIHDYLEDAPGARQWRFLAPGVQQMPLSFSVGGVRARVVRFKPGFVVPEHAHAGLEMVLVLDGELTDGATHEVFKTGDLSRREAGAVHTQRITSKDPCVCLVVSEAPIVPSTVWGKLLQALTGV